LNATEARGTFEGGLFLFFEDFLFFFFFFFVLNDDLRSVFWGLAVTCAVAGAISCPGPISCAFAAAGSSSGAFALSCAGTGALASTFTAAFAAGSCTFVFASADIDLDALSCASVTFITARCSSFVAASPGALFHTHAGVLAGVDLNLYIFCSFGFSTDHIARCNGYIYGRGFLSAGWDHLRRWLARNRGRCFYPGHNDVRGLWNRGGCRLSKCRAALQQAFDTRWRSS
jgi:hypothetical protein